MRTVVVALSRFACAGDVLDAAVAEAGPPPARVVLVHVVEPITPRLDELDGEREQALIQSAKRWIEPFAEVVRKRGYHALVQVAYGGIVESVVEAARDQRAELLVVGSKGRRGLAHLILGSTERSLARNASCPLMTVSLKRKAGCASSCQWCEATPDPLRADFAAEDAG